MNAKPQTPPTSRQQPRRQAKPTSIAAKKHRSSPHQHQVLEATLQTGIYGFICVVGTLTIVNLTTYNLMQQHKLNQLRTEINTTQQRMHAVSQEFTRTFDSRNAERIQLEQTYRVAPTRLPIVVYDRDRDRSN